MWAMLETSEGSALVDRLKTGLEFAPGTTDDSKKIIARMAHPADLLGAYREAREKFNTGDIVLAMSDQGPEIQYCTRFEYTSKRLRELYGKRASEFKMWSHSAHSIMKLPRESEAMWLVVDIQRADFPIMCVIYAVPYTSSNSN